MNFDYRSAYPKHAIPSKFAAFVPSIQICSKFQRYKNRSKQKSQIFWQYL